MKSGRCEVVAMSSIRKSIFLFILFALVFFGEETREAHHSQVIANDGKIVSFPVFSVNLSPSLCNKGTVEISSTELRALKQLIERLPEAARTIHGKPVKRNHIDQETIFVTSLVLKAIKRELDGNLLQRVFHQNVSNKKLGKLFIHSCSYHIKPLKNALANLIANRLDCTVEENASSQCARQGFGWFEKEQLAYIEKHLTLRKNGLTECTVADYIGLYGLKSVLKNNELYLSNRKLTSLEGLEFVPSQEKMTKIYLDRNHFLGPSKDPAFPQAPFVHYKQVCLLSMETSGLRDLSENFLMGLTSLRTLHLAQNQLQEWPVGLFAHTPNLVHLDLSHNQFTELPQAGFDPLGQIQWIFLNHNQLTTLPEGVFRKNPLLFNLNLARNRLTTLPASMLKGLRALHFLTLDENELTVLPPSIFQGLPHFQWLSVGQNFFLHTEESFRQKYQLPWDQIMVIYGIQRKH